MITVRGQLAIRKIHGSNGDFNVGRLISDIGEFVVKDTELDQYQEGKYGGDFGITRISPYSYHTNGRFVVEVRAILGSMTLSDIDALSARDAVLVTPQEIDPADEETPKLAPGVKSDNPLEDTTPFGLDVPAKSRRTPKADSLPSEQAEDTDEALFGITLWPLGDVVKLDATVGRHQFRRQMVRLGELGYTFNGTTQDWHKGNHALVSGGELSG